MRTSTKKVLSGLVIALSCCLLTGCGAEFDTPIRWAGGQFIQGATITDDPMSLQLDSDGKGVAENLPHGVSETKTSGGTCISVASDERYSGPINWREVDNYSIEVWFEESRYLVGDGSGKLGSQSWGELQFARCGKGAGFWQMGIVCGNPGPSYSRLNLPECDELPLN